VKRFPHRFAIGFTEGLFLEVERLAAVHQRSRESMARLLIAEALCARRSQSESSKPACVSHVDRGESEAWV